MAATAQADISDTGHKEIPAFASGMRNAGERLGKRLPAAQDTAKTTSSEVLGETGQDAVTTTTLVTAQSSSRHRQTRRARILVDATREFSRLTRPSAEEIAHYKELFYELAGHVPASDRRLVSAILARLVFTPRPIAIYLAQDEIEIAAPFLLFSPVLGERDLEAIGTKMGMRYRDIIARRNSTGSNGAPEATRNPASDDDNVIETGRSTFLLHRDSLEPYSREPETSDFISTHPDDQKKPLTGEEIVALASAGGKLGRRTHSVQDVQGNHGENAANRVRSVSNPGCAGVSITETRKLLHFARTGDADAFALLVEEACGLDRASVRRLFRAKGGVEILYLIRALGIPRPHDLQIMLLVHPETGRSLEAYKQAKSLLGELDQGICRMIFNEIGARFVIPGRAETTSIQRQPASPPSGAGISGFTEALRERRAALTQRQTRRTEEEWSIPGRVAS